MLSGWFKRNRTSNLGIKSRPFAGHLAPGRDAGDLRAIAETVDGIHAGEAKLRELVELARGRGRSWGEIAIALGVSRQAAHERFADKIHA